MFMPAIPRDSLLSYQSITAKHDRPVRFLAAYMYAAIIRSTITKAETWRKGIIKIAYKHAQQMY